METVFDDLNQFFDHIYVITLQRAVERHENIRKNLDGLDYEFFYGADKKDFSVETLEQEGIYDKQKAIELHRYNKAMNGGQIGCAWSHKLVHQDMLDKGYEKVLILEDDVSVNPKGLQLFHDIIRELPPNWELLYLDHAKNTGAGIGGTIKRSFYHVLKMAGALKWSHKTIANLYAKKYSPHLKRAGFHDYTDAYAITTSAAKKLVDLQTPIAYVADNLLAHACTSRIVNAFICIPNVFSQESQTNKNAVSFVTD
jgi:glycosyl transferase, family 25